jgi:stalled ribosome rescue protein Dom34
MSVFVIWIDQEHAKIFQFSNEKMERKNIAARHQDHHTHRLDHLDLKQQEKAFFSDTAAQLSDAKRVLILGPGAAKQHFQNYLVENQPALGKKIVGCETVDHPTDAQIAALARKFFNVSVAVSTV